MRVFYEQAAPYEPLRLLPFLRTARPCKLSLIDHDRRRLQRSLEALLFVASEALSIERLAKLTGAGHVSVAAALAEIAEDCAGRGIVLREIAGGYRFATSPAARAAVEAYLLPPKTILSAAAMETLAIVAYSAAGDEGRDRSRSRRQRGQRRSDADRPPLHRGSRAPRCARPTGRI